MLRGNHLRLKALPAALIAVLCSCAPYAPETDTMPELSAAAEPAAVPLPYRIAVVPDFPEFLRDGDRVTGLAVLTSSDERDFAGSLIRRLRSGSLEVETAGMPVTLPAYGSIELPLPLAVSRDGQWRLQLQLADAGKAVVGETVAILTVLPAADRRYGLHRGDLPPGEECHLLLQVPEGIAAEGVRITPSFTGGPTGIYLDGQELRPDGTAGLTLSPGPHSLRIANAGPETLRWMVETVYRLRLAEAEPDSPGISLERSYMLLTPSEENDAEVEVDGAHYRRTPAANLGGLPRGCLVEVNLVLQNSTALPPGVLIDRLPAGNGDNLPDWTLEIPALAPGRHSFSRIFTMPYPGRFRIPRAEYRAGDSATGGFTAASRAAVFEIRDPQE